jgi:hypothetical protein
VPELLRLLRRDAGSAAQPLIADDPGDQDPDQLRPFTGILAAIALSVPIWITIAGLLYYLI